MQHSVHVAEGQMPKRSEETKFDLILLYITEIWRYCTPHTFQSIQYAFYISIKLCIKCRWEWHWINDEQLDECTEKLFNVFDTNGGIFSLETRSILFVRTACPMALFEKFLCHPFLLHPVASIFYIGTASVTTDNSWLSVSVAILFGTDQRQIARVPRAPTHFRTLALTWNLNNGRFQHFLRVLSFVWPTCHFICAVCWTVRFSVNKCVALPCRGSHSSTDSS